jgi:hypothetical protein
VETGTVSNPHVTAGPVEAEALPDFPTREACATVDCSGISIGDIVGIAFGRPPTDKS